MMVLKFPGRGIERRAQRLAERMCATTNENEAVGLLTAATLELGQELDRAGASWVEVRNWLAELRKGV